MTMHFKQMTGQDEWLWFQQRTRTIYCEDSIGIIAFDERGIQAMAVCDTWTVDSCCIHYCIANPFAIRAGFFHEVFNYVFNLAGRTHIFGLTPSTNKKSIKLNKHFGMTQVTTIPDAVSKGVDILVTRMDKADCRWIEQPVEERSVA